MESERLLLLLLLWCTHDVCRHNTLEAGELGVGGLGGSTPTAALAATESLLAAMVGGVGWGGGKYSLKWS